MCWSLIIILTIVYHLIPLSSLSRLFTTDCWTISNSLLSEIKFDFWPGRFTRSHHLCHIQLESTQWQRRQCCYHIFSTSQLQLYAHDILLCCPLRKGQVTSVLQQYINSILNGIKQLCTLPDSVALPLSPWLLTISQSVSYSVRVQISCNLPWALYINSVCYMA